MSVIRRTRTLSIGLVSLIWLLSVTTVMVAANPLSASKHQDDNDNVVYTVQPGDTLTLIALQHNLSLANIVLANNLANPNLIFPGQQLILPGVALAPPPTAKALESPLPPEQSHRVEPGETLFSIAGRYDVPIGAIVLANDLTNPDVIQVGQTLQIPSGPLPTPEPLTTPFVTIELSERVIIQGRTLVVKVTLSEPATLGGTFEGRPLFFSQHGDNQYWTIIAIHALTEPNDYPINLIATLPDETPVTTYEYVTVVAGPYGTEDIQLDEQHSRLLNDELIRQEREKLVNLWSRASLRPQWEGPFLYPVDTNSLRITSNYGTRRSYNSGPATSFHGGTDFGGGVGVPIYAAAAGTVVLAEELTLRGNAVLIDHGMGLFSGYWHHSQLMVTAGQQVQAGDLIGTMGASGLVTGPHLHWEMRLQGIAVDPLQWIQESIP